MTICCLGDLVLDVIVRLEQPLAADADATSQIVLRPGGQGANVAAWVAALGGTRAVRREARRRRRGGARGGSGCVELGVELAGPVEPAGNGVIVSLVQPTGRTDDVRRPRRRDRAPARRGRRRRGSRTARTSTSRATRSSASRSGSRRPRAVEHARGRRGAGQRRPLLVERDPRLRRRALPRRSRAARAGRRLRERGRGRDRRRPDRWAAPGSSSAGLPAPRSTATSGRRCRSEVVDSTGAGDAFAAGWLVGGPDLALEAAARCVGQAGSMPARR